MQICSETCCAGAGGEPNRFQGFEGALCALLQEINKIGRKPRLWRGEAGVCGEGGCPGEPVPFGGPGGNERSRAGRSGTAGNTRGHSVTKDGGTGVYGGPGEGQRLLIHINC